MATGHTNNPLDLRAAGHASSKKPSKRYRIDNSRHFRLNDHDPADTNGLEMDKERAGAILAQDIVRLERLQERLYAQHRWAVLVTFQAMGTAGKDSAIKHVMSGINPQGCEVQGSRRPRTSITIFYGGRRLGCQGGRGSASSTAPVTKKRGSRAFILNCWSGKNSRLNCSSVTSGGTASTNQCLERHLTKNGTVILKFFLNVSKQEQKCRFLERLDSPAKRWKLSSVITERTLWSRYMQA